MAPGVETALGRRIDIDLVAGKVALFDLEWHQLAAPVPLEVSRSIGPAAGGVVFEGDSVAAEDAAVRSGLQRRGFAGGFVDDLCGPSVRPSRVRRWATVESAL